MATIDAELEIAQKALEALNTLSSPTVDEAIGTLRRVREEARRAMITVLSSEEGLINARHDVDIKFGDLIRALQQGSFAPDKIESARRAVEDWITELKALEV